MEKIIVEMKLIRLMLIHRAFYVNFKESETMHYTFNEEVVKVLKAVQ